ncbi:MAG: serine/threonine protein kinase [Chloroflexi bacterium]|nr:serine/threonine protein kinase [Chloroflexota bacterium]
MPFDAGEQVGPYQIVGQLGQGGMAAVYKAYHPALDRYVAIKTMHSALAEDDSFLARFRREAQIIAKLEHPHIVPVHDFNEHEGQPYLVMKYVEGHTLKDELDDNKLTLAQALHILKAVAAALSYAHQQGVLHRDVKPSNVIIDTRNIPYVSDFGLARLIASGDSTLSNNAILGTPQYMSPEQALTPAAIDARADVYSLGVMLYEIVLGRVPFSGDTPYAIIHDHIYTPLPLPSQVDPRIPPQIELVLMKALAKDPEERYDSAVLLVRDFWKALSDAQMNELPPDRVRVADASLAKLRTELRASVANAGEAQTPPLKALRKPLPPAAIKPTASTRLAHAEHSTKPIAAPIKGEHSLAKHLTRRDNVSDLYQQVSSNRGSGQLDRLMARIPGFTGYQEMQARRAADRLLRDYLAEQLSVRITRFVSAEKTLLDSGGLLMMSKTAAVKSKMQLYRDRVKAVAPGYSGFFAAINIGPQELEQLYNFDEGQVQYVDRLTEAVENFDKAAKANQGVAEALEALETVADEANEAFTLREETLTNLDKMLGS